MTQPPAATLRLSAEVADARLEDLTRQLHRDLLQAEVTAGRPQTVTEPGQRGEPVTLGTIVLAVLSSHAVAALINVVKAMIERERTLKVEITTPDGRRVPVDARAAGLAAVLAELGLKTPPPSQGPLPSHGPLPSQSPLPSHGPPPSHGAPLAAARTAMPGVGASPFAEAGAGRRRAFLIGNASFPLDETLATLRGPGNDVAALARLLGDAERGGWEVETFVDCPAADILAALDEAFGEAGPRDRMLIFYAGHGKLDAAGRLCLAAAGTRPKALFSSSVPARYLRDMVESSRAASTVLLLDCCYAGAVGAELARGDVESQMALLREAHGLYILTASTRVQAAREAETERDGLVFGRFTDAIVAGIESGEADVDGDGVVSLSDLNRHLARTVRGQTPQYWAHEASGDPEILRLRPAVPPVEKRLARLGAWYAGGKLPEAEYYALAALVEGETADEAAALAAVNRALDRPESTAGAVLAAWRGFRAKPAEPARATAAGMAAGAPGPAPQAGAASGSAIAATTPPPRSMPWPLLGALAPALGAQLYLSLGAVNIGANDHNGVMVVSTLASAVLLAAAAYYFRARLLNLRAVAIALTAAPLVLFNTAVHDQCYRSTAYGTDIYRGVSSYRSCMSAESVPFLLVAAGLLALVLLGPPALRLARARWAARGTGGPG